MSKTKQLFGKQKQTIKIIPMTDIHTNLNPDEKMKHLDMLNIYKLNLYQILNMFPVKTNSIPETLHYSTRTRTQLLYRTQLFYKIQRIQFQRARYFT